VFLCHRALSPSTTASLSAPASSPPQAEEALYTDYSGRLKHSLEDGEEGEEEVTTYRASCMPRGRKYITTMTYYAVERLGDA